MNGTTLKTHELRDNFDFVLRANNDSLSNVYTWILDLEKKYCYIEYPLAKPFKLGLENFFL